MPENDVVIATDQLCKVYRDFWGRAAVKAVTDLDLRVERGQIYGLLGPNGSGKTTTIMLLLGLIFPTRGRATVLDRPAGHLRAKRLIGYLPEETYLYKFLTAEQTLHFFGKLFNLPHQARRRRVDELLEMVGLDKKDRKRRVGTYSKGMARRIGLAQALINDPEVLILDEPTSGLDPLGSVEMKELLNRLQSAGKTILLSSHLLADVEDVCDRVLILYRGQMEMEGAVDDLLDVKDVWQLQIRGGSEAMTRQIESLAHAEGAEVLRIGHRRQRLEDLFKTLIRQKMDE